MRIEDYLSLYNSNIKTSIDTNPTDFTEESLREELVNTVNKLKPYRLDDYMTRQTLINILRKYQRAVKTPDGEIDHYDGYSVNNIVLSHILLKYFKREVSFHYAYVLLQQEENCRTAFSKDIHFLSEQEVEDAVLEDMARDKEKEAKKETFEHLLIHDRKGNLVKLLHELLDYKNGKDVVIVIKALERLQLIKPYNSVSNLHRILTDEFEDIGTLRNFSNYMNGTSNCNIQDADIEKYIVLIKDI